MHVDFSLSASGTSNRTSDYFEKFFNLRFPTSAYQHSLRLCDLDESAWARFTPETCKRLARGCDSQHPSGVALFLSSTRVFLSSRSCNKRRTSARTDVRGTV